MPGSTRAGYTMKKTYLHGTCRDHARSALATMELIGPVYAAPDTPEGMRLAAHYARDRAFIEHRGEAGRPVAIRFTTDVPPDEAQSHPGFGADALVWRHESLLLTSAEIVEIERDQPE